MKKEKATDGLVEQQDESLGTQTSPILLLQSKELTPSEKAAETSKGKKDQENRYGSKSIDCNTNLYLSRVILSLADRVRKVHHSADGKKEGLPWNNLGG